MQRSIRDANAVKTLFGGFLMGIHVDNGRLPDSFNYVYENLNQMLHESG